MRSVGQQRLLLIHMLCVCVCVSVCAQSSWIPLSSIFCRRRLCTRRDGFGPPSYSRPKISVCHLWSNQNPVAFPSVVASHFLSRVFLRRSNELRGLRRTGGERRAGLPPHWAPVRAAGCCRDTTPSDVFILMAETARCSDTEHALLPLVWGREPMLLCRQLNKSTQSVKTTHVGSTLPPQWLSHWKQTIYSHLFTDFWPKPLNFHKWIWCHFECGLIYILLPFMSHKEHVSAVSYLTTQSLYSRYYGMFLWYWSACHFQCLTCRWHSGVTAIGLGSGEKKNGVFLSGMRRCILCCFYIHGVRIYSS